MDRILKILKKENGPRALSAPALELNTIIFTHVYWYMQQISGERLQDHWSSGKRFFWLVSNNSLQQCIERPYFCHAVSLLTLNIRFKLAKRSFVSPQEYLGEVFT